MRSEGRARDDLGTINHWLSTTRLRASGLLLAFISLLWAGGAPIDLPVAAAVIAGVCLFSLWTLRWRRRRIPDLAFFYVQHFVDLAAITIGIAASAEGEVALLFRPLFALVVIPASLISVTAGLVTATGASLGHELLLGLDRGFAWETFLSLDSFVPPFLFFLVAQQCFFYGDHLEQKNLALAHLAERLDDSRRDLAELVGIARVLNSTTNSPEVLARVNRIARERLDGDWSATLLIDLSRRTFRVAAAEHADRSSGGSPPMEVPLDGWPAIDRLARVRSLALLDADAATLPDFLSDGRRFRCLRLAGLFGDEELVGVLAVGHERLPADANPGPALQRLVDIAEHATIALRNARLLEEARQASALKSEFVSTMSHELRTPLNVILGYTEILRDEARESPDEIRELLARIDGCGRELLDLVDATLQVGRLEAGAIKVEREPVTIAELLRSFVATTAGLPRRPDVRLEWDCRASPRASLDTDRAKVALVVRNLVSNALKFTHGGSVRVELRSRGAMLEIAVRDTGVGVPPEKLSVIFEMFRQADTPSQTSQSGVGLGLYIVDQLVRRLDGEIDVASTPGEGSSFVVRLRGYAEAEDASSGPDRPSVVRTGI